MILIQTFLYLHQIMFVMNNTNVDDLRYLFEKIKENKATLHAPMLQVINESIEHSYIKYGDWRICYQKGCICVKIADIVRSVCFTTHELITLIKCYDNIEIIKDDENEIDK